MKSDPRFCPICDKLLLKQDHKGFVLVLRCDQCNKLVHESCYLNHHISQHKLIAVITEVEEKELSYFYR